MQLLDLDAHQLTHCCSQFTAMLKQGEVIHLQGLPQRSSAATDEQAAVQACCAIFSACTARSAGSTLS